MAVRAPLVVRTRPGCGHKRLPGRRRLVPRRTTYQTDNWTDGTRSRRSRSTLHSLLRRARSQTRWEGVRIGCGRTSHWSAHGSSTATGWCRSCSSASTCSSWTERTRWVWPHHERLALLDSLELEGVCWRTGPCWMTAQPCSGPCAPEAWRAWWPSGWTIPTGRVSVAGSSRRTRATGGWSRSECVSRSPGRGQREGLSVPSRSNLKPVGAKGLFPSGRG